MTQKRTIFENIHQQCSQTPLRRQYLLRLTKHHFVAHNIHRRHHQQSNFRNTPHNHGPIIIRNTIIHPHRRRANTHHAKQQRQTIRALVLVNNIHENKPPNYRYRSRTIRYDFQVLVPFVTHLLDTQKTNKPPNYRYRSRAIRYDFQVLIPFVTHLLDTPKRIL